MTWTPGPLAAQPASGAQLGKTHFYDRRQCQSEKQNFKLDIRVLIYLHLYSSVLGTLLNKQKDKNHK